MDVGTLETGILDQSQAEMTSVIKSKLQSDNKTQDDERDTILKQPRGKPQYILGFCLSIRS